MQCSRVLPTEAGAYGQHGLDQQVALLNNSVHSMQLSPAVWPHTAHATTQANSPQLPEPIENYSLGVAPPAAHLSPGHWRAGRCGSADAR